MLLPHENYTDEELIFILKHELVHHQRRDILVKMLLLNDQLYHAGEQNPAQLQTWMEEKQALEALRARFYDQLENMLTQEEERYE